jgi:hypothetical protein
VTECGAKSVKYAFLYWNEYEFEINKKVSLSDAMIQRYSAFLLRTCSLDLCIFFSQFLEANQLHQLVYNVSETLKDLRAVLSKNGLQIEPALVFLKETLGPETEDVPIIELAMHCPGKGLAQLYDLVRQLFFDNDTWFRWFCHEFVSLTDLATHSCAIREWWNGDCRRTKPFRDALCCIFMKSVDSPDVIFRTFADYRSVAPSEAGISLVQVLLQSSNPGQLNLLSLLIWDSPFFIEEDRGFDAWSFIQSVTPLIHEDETSRAALLPLLLCNTIPRFADVLQSAFRQNACCGDPGDDTCRCPRAAPASVLMVTGNWTHSTAFDEFHKEICPTGQNDSLPPRGERVNRRFIQSSMDQSIEAPSLRTLPVEHAVRSLAAMMSCVG